MKGFHLHITERTYTPEEENAMRVIEEDIQKARELGLQEHSAGKLKILRNRKFVVELPPPLSKEELMVLDAYFPVQKHVSHLYIEDLPSVALDALEKGKDAFPYFSVYMESQGSGFGQHALIGVKTGLKEDTCYLLALWTGNERLIPGNKEHLPDFRQMALAVQLRFLNGRTDELGSDARNAAKAFGQTRFAGVAQGALVFVLAFILLVLATRMYWAEASDVTRFLCSFAVSAGVGWWHAVKTVRKEWETIISESGLLHATQIVLHSIS